MNILEELEKLKPLIGTGDKGFKQQFELIKSNFNSESDKRVINDFMIEAFRESADTADVVVKELKMKAKLAEVSEIVSFSYIAKKYFNKSRSWLNQRINEHIVNGKPAKFTMEELETLRKAFQDISQKTGSISV